MSLDSALRLLAHVEGPVLAARLGDGVILSVNRPFASLLGYSQVQLLGTSIDALGVPGHDGLTINSGLLREPGPLSSVALRTASGATLEVPALRWHLARGSDSPLCALSLEPRELSTRLAEVLASKHVALQRTMTELQQAFNQLKLQNDELDLRHREQAMLHSKLARSMRLAAIGEMSAGMAHTIRNPLAAVSSGLGRLQRDLRGASPDCEACASLAQRCLVAAGRISGIVDRFQHLSPSSRPGVAAVSVLAEEVALALELLAHRMDPGVSVAVEIPPGLRVAVASEDLNLILSNLIDNAMHALAGGGLVRIHAAAGESDVHLRVKDDGAGVDPGVRDRLFEPFVTTRLDGCGVGLSLVRAAAERNGGSVSLEASSGQGTVFLVRLPAPATGAEHEHA